MRAVNGGECSEIKWLLPLMAEFQKSLPDEAKKSFFVIECLKGCVTAEKLIDLHIWERPRGFYFFYLFIYFFTWG